MNPRETSLDWVRRALAEELPAEDVASLATRAENLVAIAEQSQMPVDLLISWIHSPVPGKEWSASEFRGFAEIYVAVLKARAQA